MKRLWLPYALISVLIALFWSVFFALVFPALDAPFPPARLFLVGLIVAISCFFVLSMCNAAKD